MAEEVALYRNFMRKYFSDFYPEEAENFLCFTTRFEEDERVSVEQAYNHMLLSGWDQGGFLRGNAEALGGLFRCFLKNDSLEISKALFNTFLKNLCGHFSRGDRWFELEEGGDEEEAGQHRFIIEKKNSLVQYLSYEFGISVDHLWNRLMQVKAAGYRYVEADELSN